MEKQESVVEKKPFVEPKLTEEASLEDVTLMSGGANYGHGGSHLKKPKHGGRNRGREHGHGRSNRHS